MGLFSFLFGGKKSEDDSSSDPRSEFYEPSEKYLMEAELCFKEAVKFKKTNVEEAVLSLRKAYTLDEKYDLRLGTDKYTRLPKYLQNAGRSAEALDEMGRLTAYGTPLSKQSYSDYNYHMSECHSAFAIIKKKQKVSPEEVLAEKCLADIYDLNAFYWSLNQKLSTFKDMGISESSKEYKDEKKWFLKNADDKVKRIEDTYPEIGSEFNIRDLSFPVKNIDEQSFYDVFMSEDN